MQKTTDSNRQRELTDERLLTDYLARQDAGAFAAIVERHGPMVFGVCRRILYREQDVEDAFQASFLVLIRKARSLTRPQLLGNWLYGVAYRTANKIRSAGIRQRKREVPMSNLPNLPAPEADHEMIGRELRSILDDELQRLPARYRATVVLFYLEGKTVEEVATTLGSPKGTILARLARARERLRFRLIRRGLTLSAGILGAVLARTASSEGAVPQQLLEWSKHAATVPSIGHGGAQDVSPPARLAQRVLKDMRRKQLLWRAAIVLVVLLFLGVGILGSRSSFFLPAIEPPHSAADATQLQGTWEVVAVQSDGQTLPRARFPYTRLTVVGDTILHEGGEHDLKVTFRLDASQKPRAIDMQCLGYHTDIYLAVYALDGDTLTICRPDHGDRPTELASKPGTRTMLITAKRSPVSGR